jgi:peptide/nickel transport system permease protein
MLRFLAGRLVKGVLVLLAIAVLNFFLIRAAPGDPAQVMAGEAGAADEVFLQQLRARFGLDRPVLEQLWIYLREVLTLDLGFSYRQQRPVVDLIAERLPATLLLTGAAFVVSLALGATLGVLAARRAGRWSDTAITTVALMFYATPLFWIALMGQIVFALKLGWLPNVGYETIGANYTGLARAADIGAHLVLPALTLGLFGSALYARLTREEVASALGQDFARAARARGASNARVLVVHALRNALAPLTTMAALDLGTMVSGAVVTERIFRWPGVGQLAVDAVLNRDGPVIFGTVLFSAAAVVVATFTLDVVDVLLDPRLRSR